MNDVDVVIIGAGPAGALTALGLARSGKRVLLCERAARPREKVCGGCLSGPALAALSRLGLKLGHADRAGTLCTAPLTRCRFDVAGVQATFPLASSCVVDRTLFDEWLISAAMRAGAIVRDRSSAHVLHACKDHAVVEVSGGDRVRCGFVIDASGIGSRALPPHIAPRPVTMRTSRMGCGTRLDAACEADLPFGMLRMIVGRVGYAGLVRLPNGEIDVAAAVDPACVRALGGPAETIVAILREGAGNTHASIERAVRGARWRGTGKLTVRRQVVAGPGWCAIGDAAGYSEPVTGEGIGWALREAEALVGIAAEDGWTPRAQRTWTRRMRGFTRERRTSRLLAAALRHPRLFGYAMTLPLLPHRILRAIGRSSGAHLHAQAGEHVA